MTDVTTPDPVPPGERRRRSWAGLLLEYFQQNPERVLPVSAVVMHVTKDPREIASISSTLSRLSRAGLLDVTSQPVDGGGDRKLNHFSLTTKGRQFRGDDRQLMKIVNDVKEAVTNGTMPRLRQSGPPVRQGKEGSKLGVARTGVVVLGRVLTIEEAREIFNELGKLFAAGGER